MPELRVGFDIGPLHGARTGIGAAVAALHAELGRHESSGERVELCEYVTSFRARPTPGVRRLPLPAALAHRLWANCDWPKADRWLRGVAVVHGTNYVVPPVTVPRLVSVYDCWFLRNPHVAQPAVVRAGRVLRRAVAHGAVVHTSSHATADAIRELLPTARVVPIHLGALPLPPPPARPPISDLVGKPFVLAVGTLERRKNLSTLVRAFGDLADELPDVELVLAGADGDDRPAIDSAVDGLGRTSKRVMFTGRVDDSVRSWLLHHAAVLAYPSLDEGFGFPLLEAMQAQLPIVASNAGSIPEIGGAALLQSAPTDVAALAANLKAALSDSSVRTQLLFAGDAQWREFTWQRCATELTSLYRQLASGEFA